MKITVCGSMTHYLKMLDIKAQLAKLGHTVVLPDPENKKHLEDTSDLKIKYGYIKKHFCHIVELDCILIANYDKKGIKNYIGGNALFEIGYAHILNRPIYLLNPVPKIDFYYHEILAVNPIVLNGDLKKLSL